MSFTLFIVLPNKDVCSLRHLASGVSIRAVRKDLELSAGLPAQTYRLTTSDGHVLHEDHVLRMDVNVWDGYVIRAVFLDSWQELYDHIVANDVDHVIKYGAVHMRGDVVWVDWEEKERAREVMRERGVVALFVASFLGMLEMCRALLSVGVNPNGKSLFGRTPLFAAMLRDHDHVMELLLSHSASLESRDTDGVTAVDIARRATAKQCLRKVRHLHLQSKGESTATSPSGPSEAVRRRGPRVIRIPGGAAEHRDSSMPSTSAAKPGTSQDESPHRRSLPTPGTEACTGASEAGEGRPPSQAPPQQLPPKHSRVPQPRALFRQVKDAELYLWDNHVSRAPSAAGTQVRLSLASSSEGQILNRREAHGNRGSGSAWSDSKSVTSSAPRMLPFRPTVQELSIKGPSSVLTTTSTTSIPTLSDVTLSGLRREDRNVKQRRPSALVRFLTHSPHSQTSSSTLRPQRPHGPAREPSGRPPTRADSSLASSELQDQQQGGSVGTGSVMGSQEALSVGSAPELTTGEDAKTGGEAADADHGESDDDGGRVVTSHATGARFSSKNRTRLLVSRQKQQESWKTMKRRIRLAEEQKRNAALKLQQNHKARTDTKETFEQWLERKRREQHSTDDDTSEDDEDMLNRMAENSQILNGWLKDLRQPSPRPQTSSHVPSHRQKTRSPKSPAEMGGPGGGSGADRQTEADSHVTGYRQWQHRKKRGPAGPQATFQDTEEAKLQLEEKRKSLLAMALTFQNWTEHAEQRKKLMQAILRADLDKLAAIEQHLLHTQQAPRQISFNEWREKVDRKEAEIRHQRQRMRKEAEGRPRNGVTGEEVARNNATYTQEEGRRQKKETATKERDKARRSVDAGMKDGDSGTLSEDEKENALEEWLRQKHKHEVAQLNQHLRQERQLLLSVRQKKPPTVTPC